MRYFLHFANCITVRVIKIALQSDNKRLKLLEIRANEIEILFCKIFARKVNTTSDVSGVSIAVNETDFVISFGEYLRSKTFII